MFNFINFATVIVFLVTMFDDSTQLVTVPRSSLDPIAELCRALVVLKRERYHIREVFKLSSDGHTEKVYWYGRSQYIEALNAPHHINENVSCYTTYASGKCRRTPCKLDYDTHRVFDIVVPCDYEEEDGVVVERSILLPPENDGTVRDEVRIFDLDERDECGELPDPKTIEGLYRGYKDRDMYWMCADEKVIEPSDAVRYVRQRALAQYLTDSGHAGLLIEDNFEPLEEEPLKRTTDWLASKDESRFEELYTAYAAGLYAAQKSRQPQNGSRIQKVRPMLMDTEEMRPMLIKNIKWDTDGDMEALASLPTEVYTPPFLHQEWYDDIEEFLDDVSDWLSDEYGWCHFGFETETNDGEIIKCDTLPE